MTAGFQSSGRKLCVTWESFWYSEGSTFNLALFRILFATCLYREVGISFNMSRFAIEGGFHLPYLGFIQPLTENAYQWVHNLQYPFILLVAVGIFTRTSCSVILLLQGYIFFADQLNFRNHPYFFLLVLLLLLFSPADDALSVKSILRALKNRQPVIASFLGSQQPLTFQRLIQVQVCIVYLYAAFHKGNMGYLNGQVLDHYLHQHLLGPSEKILGALLSDALFAGLLDFLFKAETLMTLSIFTVVLEFALPLALWFRKARPYALILGTILHLGIALSMGIYTFSLAMIGSYLLFLDPRTLTRHLPPALSQNRPNGGT